jgi:hypothetical protein
MVVFVCSVGEKYATFQNDKTVEVKSKLRTEITNSTPTGRLHAGKQWQQYNLDTNLVFPVILLSIFQHAVTQT